MNYIALLLPNCKLIGPAHVLPIEMEDSQMGLNVQIHDSFEAHQRIGFSKLVRLSILGVSDFTVLSYELTVDVKPELINQLIKKVLTNKLWRRVDYPNLPMPLYSFP